MILTLTILFSLCSDTQAVRRNSFRMTHILSAQSAQVQQTRNLALVAQGAIQERNAVLKQLSGLKELTNELHHTQQDVAHHKDRANQCEMGLLRTEAHLKKTQKALWDTTNAYSELQDRVKSLEDERTTWISERERLNKGSEPVARDVSDSSELEIDSAPIVDEDGNVLHAGGLQPRIFCKVSYYHII